MEKGEKERDTALPNILSKDIFQMADYDTPSKTINVYILQEQIPIDIMKTKAVSGRVGNEAQTQKVVEKPKFVLETGELNIPAISKNLGQAAIAFTDTSLDFHLDKASLIGGSNAEIRIINPPLNTLLGSQMKEGDARPYTEVKIKGNFQLDVPEWSGNYAKGLVAELAEQRSNTQKSNIKTVNLCRGSGLFVDINDSLLFERRTSLILLDLLRDATKLDTKLQLADSNNNRMYYSSFRIGNIAESYPTQQELRLVFHTLLALSDHIVVSTSSF